MTHHPEGSNPYQQPADRYAPPQPAQPEQPVQTAPSSAHPHGQAEPPAQPPAYGAPVAHAVADAPTQAAPSGPSHELRAALAAVRTEVGKAVVGQDAAVTSLLIAMLCKGHVLLEGVPGVAKTLLVRTLAASLDLDTKRVQFTPDLMPGDVTGSLVYDARTAEFSFREGPVFTNLLLADEINRTPPKTQASLLEAMEERQVSVDGTPRMLPDPFLVIATQNPVEYEGTYPLPEAQLDRFLLKLVLPLPERDQEIEVLARHAAGFNPRDLAAAGVRPVAGREVLDRARAEVAQVQVSREVLGYAVDLCRATRHSPSLSLGVSPRGATALLATSRAWAWLSGRGYVTPDDVKALAHPTLRHRVQLRPEAELEGVTAESVLDTVLASVPVPR
uniref:AAA family ATPase n=1 Tax=Oerskovia gallyi TaxID=2762226 RepID=UPI00296AEFA3|nr:MoxR family ATPase [Oerskovia gallyi]